MKSQLNEVKKLQKIAGILKEAEGTDIYDWIENWSQENGSAVEIWGDEDLWEKIKEMVDSGVKVKAVDSEQKINKFRKMGWKVLESEEIDAIIYKK